MPTVMPSRSSATTSFSVTRLSDTGRGLLGAGAAGVTTFDEGIAQLVGHAREVELEGEALLVAVGALHVPQVDTVQALLGRPDDGRRLRRDLAGDVEGSVAQLVTRH